MVPVEESKKTILFLFLFFDNILSKEMLDKMEKKKTQRISKLESQNAN